jgi:hypothetical protein
MTLSLDLDGARLDEAGISTLREALSIAEEAMTKKPVSGVHLFAYLEGFKVIWWDGGALMIEEVWYREFFTTKASA